MMINGVSWSKNKLYQNWQNVWHDSYWWNYKMNFDAPSSTWMPSPSPRPVVTFTFDLWPPKSNQVISMGQCHCACKFYQDDQAVLARLWDIVVTRSAQTNERTNERDGRTDENTKPLPTLLCDKGIKRMAKINHLRTKLVWFCFVK